MKLTIGMIVKNESKYLKRCLEALDSVRKSIDSELIIVDTGSIDDTVEIAKEFTDKVFFYKWDNDFAKARNITIEKSKGEWYFYLDADEILENPKDIIDFFKYDNYKEYEAMAIKIENLKNEDDFEIGSTFYSKRIVKKDSNLKFSNKIHEHLPDKNPTYLSKTAKILHYGYMNKAKKIIEKKYIRNIEILKKELEKDPDNTYYLYHLSRTYNANSEYFKALEAAKKALDITRKSKTERIYIYEFCLDLLIKNKAFYEAEILAKEALKLDEKESSAHINIYFFLAQVQGVINKYTESIKNYEKCVELLKLYEEDKLLVDLNTLLINFGGEIYIYSQIATEYDTILDYQNSLEYTQKVIDLTKENRHKDDYFYQAIRHTIELGIKYEEYDIILRLYNQILNEYQLYRPEAEYKFINTLEYIINNDEEAIRRKIIDIFANLDFDTDYVFLNRIRSKKLNGEPLSIEDINNIYTYNFNEKNEIYAELIFYLMEMGLCINLIMYKLWESEINRHIEYMNRKFDKFSQVIVAYFNKYNDDENINDLIFSKALKRVVLINANVDNTNYFSLFNRYIKEGIDYINKVYMGSILDAENIYVLKNCEEIFFMYMRKALFYSSSDKGQYLQYLRKALKSYEYMGKGIEFLLEEIKQENTKRNINEEFEEYKNMIKKNIYILIKNQSFDEAKLLVDEYLKIVPNDLEVLNLKSKYFLI